MKDEIKEILEYMKKVANKNEEDLESELSHRDCALLLECITNLRKKLKKLSKEIKKNKKEDEEIRNKNAFLVNGFHELEERIDKAIEYIEENCGADNRLALKIILTGGDEDE